MTWLATSLTKAPLICLPCNETSGTTAVDHSGNGHDGTIFSSVTINQTGPYGDPSYTYNGDPTNSRVQLPNASYLFPGTGDIAFEVWCQTTNTGFIAAVEWDNGATGFRLGQQSGTQPEGAICTADLIPAGHSINDGSWHQLIGTRISSACTFYLDGSSVATGSDSTNFTSSGFRGANLGVQIDALFWIGSLGRFAIYPTLSSSDVTDLWNAGSGATPADLSLDPINSVSSSTMTLNAYVPLTLSPINSVSSSSLTLNPQVPLVLGSINSQSSSTMSLGSVVPLILSPINSVSSSTMAIGSFVALALDPITSTSSTTCIISAPIIFVPIEQVQELYLQTNLQGVASIWALREPQDVLAIGDTTPVLVWRYAATQDFYHEQGAAGAAQKTFLYQIYSTDIYQCVVVAEQLRILLSGFQGMLGGVRILSVIHEDNDEFDWYTLEDGSDDGMAVLGVAYTYKYQQSIPSFTGFKPLPPFTTRHLYFENFP